MAKKKRASTAKNPRRSGNPAVAAGAQQAPRPRPQKPAAGPSTIDPSEHEMPGWFQESVAADPRPAFPAEAPRTPPAAGPMPLAQKLLLGAAFFGPVLAALLTFAEVYGSFTQLRSSLAAVAFACLVGFTSLLVVVLGLNALIRRSLPPEERPVRNRRRAFYSVVLCFMAILLVGSMIFPYVATEDPLAPGQSEVTEDGSTPNVFTPPGATPEPSSPGE